MQIIKPTIASKDGQYSIANHAFRLSCILCGSACSVILFNGYIVNLVNLDKKMNATAFNNAIKSEV